MKKIAVYAFSIFVLSGYFALPTQSLAADKMDDNCPMGVTLAMEPTEVKSWANPVKLNLEVRRDYGWGYYCSTKETIKLSYFYGIAGGGQNMPLRTSTLTIEPNPTGDGKLSTASESPSFTFASLGAKSDTSSVTVVVVANITRTAGYNTSTLERVSAPATVKLNAGTGQQQPPTEPAGTGYTPQNVKVCKVSDTSNRIFWTTTEPTNSALEYSIPGQTGVKKVFTTSLKDHSILLSGLTKGTTYGYALYIPVAGQKTSTATSKVLDQYRQFVAGQTQDTGCSADGSKVDNTVTTKPLDTSVGIKSGDFDKVLGSLFNPLETGTTIPSLIVRAINILLLLVGMLSVLFIIIGGFQMVTAAGNETTVAKGKKTVTYAIAGLVVSILSFSIVAIIQSIIT